MATVSLGAPIAMPWTEIRKSGSVSGKFGFFGNPDFFVFGVYRLLLTSGSMTDGVRTLQNPPEVPKSPTGPMPFQLKPLQYGCLWAPKV